MLDDHERDIPAKECLDDIEHCLTQSSEQWDVRTTAQKDTINQALTKREVLDGDMTNVMN